MSRMDRVAGLFEALEREVLELFDELGDTVEEHPLHGIFDQCIAQAVSGKGEERHGHGVEFMDQPWHELTNAFGLGGPLFQAAKKTREAVQWLGSSEEYRFKAELLGAINYIAMALLAYENQHESEPDGCALGV